MLNIPTWQSVNRKVVKVDTDNNLNALEWFVFYHEPEGPKDSSTFRRELEEAIQYYVDVEVDS